MLSPTDEIKARLDIVDLLQEYIKMQQAGANWKAKCPFHSEKTPSFMISRDKQIWHCFGCNEGGDIFTFIQKIEGVEFPEALKILANKAGVILKREDPSITSQRTRLLDINDLAAKYYHKVLLESEAAKEARGYLERRGVDGLTIDGWQLGFSPDSWDETLNFLKKKGFTEEEVFLAGLLIKKERGAGFYDRFRNRLMFPIKNHNGQVVGFSARTLDPEAKEAKYINTSQTAVFNKGQLLFGLDKAKEDIRKNKLAVLVEGNLDVITSHQFGVRNVVASCGTALTTDQVRLLKRYAENIALSFDPDAAGQIAAERGIETAWREGVNIKVITLPDGQDPDNFIRKNSVEEWQEKIQKSIPVMQYYFEKYIHPEELDDPQQKKKVVKILLPIINKISDAVERHHWLQKISETLRVPEDILRDILSKLEKKIVVNEMEKENLSTGSSVQERRSERLLGLLAQYPGNLPYVMGNLLPEALHGDQARSVYTNLIIYYNRNQSEGVLTELDINDFNKSLDPEEMGYLDRSALVISQEGDELAEDQVKGELLKIIQDLKRDLINSQLKKLEEQIKKEEAANNILAVKDLSEKFSQLTDQLYNLS